MSELDLETFQGRLEYGCCEEHEVVTFLEGVATIGDMDFLRKHKFNISDLLNGRVNEHKVNMNYVSAMKKRWNQRAGFEVIFE